jgi:prepilin-type N-terminal cleavage/methylation domain-containing protein
MVAFRRVEAHFLTRSVRTTSAGRRLARNRQGFSLLEVVLALAILVGAIAVLGELVRLGTLGAAGARDLTQAQLLCESKMAEITAGILPPDPVQYAAFEVYTDDQLESTAEWVYSIEWEATDLPGLIVIRVTVEQDLPPEHRPMSFSLARLMQEPGYVLPSEAAAEAAAASETSASTSATTSSSSP